MAAPPRPRPVGGSYFFAAQPQPAPQRHVGSHSQRGVQLHGEAATAAHAHADDGQRQDWVWFWLWFC